MRFYTQTCDEKIKMASVMANRFLDEEIHKIELPEYFTHTSHTPREIIDLVKESIGPVPVRIYTSSWFYRKVLGYFNGKAIYVNTRFFRNASLSDVAGNLVHEYFHAMGFSHSGNNVTEYNLKSVPYFFGNAAKKALS